MSNPVRYRKRFLPIRSAFSCVLEGEFIPDRDDRNGDTAISECRSRFLVFDGDDQLGSEKIWMGSGKTGNGWDFRFSVRIPSRADRLRIVFERRERGGNWNEVGCDNISIFEFPSGWIRSWASAILIKYRALRASSFKLLRKVFPGLDLWTPPEQWERFFADSETDGPRVQWTKRLSRHARRKIWHHVHDTAGSFGSLCQYKARETCFDKFPTLEVAEHLLPKLTVVTPSYNQGRFIAATMDSVAGESGTRVDYIVMDGGSNDHSIEVIGERSDKLRFWQSKPDKGQAAAIAEGFQHIDCGPSDVMAYLNSDDVFCPGAIDYVLRWFAQNPEVDVVYGHRIIIDEAGGEVGRWILPPHDPEVLALVDFVPQETLFWRRRVYDRVGGIDPSFQFAMDWDFLLKLKNSGARFERLPWFLGCFRVHGEQKTHRHINEAGAREVALLRRREHGGIPSQKLVHDAVIKTTVESFWYSGKISQGIRL